MQTICNWIFRWPLAAKGSATASLPCRLAGALHRCRARTPWRYLFRQFVGPVPPIFLGSLLTAALLASFGAGNALSAGNESARPNLLASFFPVQTLVAEVAGDQAEVVSFVGQGGLPHDYSFSRSDLQKVARADLIFVTGTEVDSWMLRAVKAASSNPKARVVSLSKNITLLPSAGLEKTGRIEKKSSVKHDHAHKHDHGPLNPHFWMNPLLTAQAVTNIAEVLSAWDPGRSQLFHRNASNFVVRLHRLDSELEAGLKPHQGAPVFTYHNAFDYLLQRYGLKLAGVIEETAEVAPSARHLSRLRQTAREQKVRALFVEPRHASRLARRLESDLGLKVRSLDPLESGSENREGYEVRMQKNLKSLQEALK